MEVREDPFLPDALFFKALHEGRSIYVPADHAVPATEEDLSASQGQMAGGLERTRLAVQDWDKRLDETLKALGFQRVFDDKDTRLLKQVLQQGEMPEAIALGLTSGGTFARVYAFLVATNRRIIFLSTGMFRSQIVDVPYSDLVTVNIHKGLVAGDISFKSHGRDSSVPGLEAVPNKMIDTFVELCRKNIEAARVPAESDSHPSPDSLITELERLAVLRDKGVLNEDEFQGQKARLLAAQPADPSLGLLCPNCGMTNARNAKFCEECGAPIPPPSLPT